MPLGKPAILYFRSDACAPCATQGRFLQQIQDEFGDRIVVEKVDADVEQAKAERYGVFTLPTTLIVDPKGTVRHANYGLADPHKLANQLRTLQWVRPADHPKGRCRMVEGARLCRRGQRHRVIRCLHGLTHDTGER